MKPRSFPLSVELLEDRVVPNAAPVIDNLLFDNTAPKTNDVLLAQVSASDGNGDPITFQYTWTVNGQVVQTTTTSATTDTLDLSLPGFGEKGDTIAITVTPQVGSGHLPLTSFTLFGELRVSAMGFFRGQALSAHREIAGCSPKL